MKTLNRIVVVSVLSAVVLVTGVLSTGVANAKLDLTSEGVRVAAKAQGVATLTDLADYYRQKTTVIKPLVNELVEQGELREVTVDTWVEKAFVHQSAKLPKKLYATALLSPFDSLVWCRPRNERLFDFHYRIEIYTPKEKRKFGYYVLPFMMNGEMVGRVDLKADRVNSKLLVQSVHTEKGIKRASINGALTDELRALANWLGLR